MNNGGSDGTSCLKIKIRTDAAKLTNVRITRFRECRDLVRESEMFIKDKAKIAGRVSGIKRRTCILYRNELLFVTNEEKFRFRGFESQDVTWHSSMKRYVQLHFVGE